MVFTPAIVLMVSSCCTGMLMIVLLLTHCSGALRRRCTRVARFDDEVGESPMLTSIGGMNLRSITFAVILAIVSLPARMAPTKIPTIALAGPTTTQEPPIFPQCTFFRAETRVSPNCDYIQADCNDGLLYSPLNAATYAFDKVSSR
jgi:hypothetical protein